MWLEGDYDHGTYFGIAPGALVQAGVLEMAWGGLVPAAGAHQLCALKVDYPSFVILPAEESCLLRFENSSAVDWSGRLLITNWSGSLYGGGAQRILFGTNSAALTAQQLSLIHFENPARLAPGWYPARILVTGEIVPDTGTPLLPMIELSCAPTNGPAQLRVGGDIGEVYGIECSTDLVHWQMWTSCVDSAGTVCLSDDEWTNFPQRLYRARQDAR